MSRRTDDVLNTPGARIGAQNGAGRKKAQAFAVNGSGDHVKPMIAFSGQLLDAADLGLSVYHLADVHDPMSLTLVEMNKASERFARVRRKDVIGKRIGEAFPGIVGTGRAEAYAEVVRSGGALEVGDISYRDARLGDTVYSVRAVPLPDSCLGIIYVDVTKQRRMEEQLGSRGNLLDMIDQSVVVVDREGRLLYVNKAAERLYGWTADELKGKVALKAVSSPQEWVQGRRQILEEGKAWSGELTLARRDGSTFEAALDGSPLLDANGAVVGIVALTSDITERKRAEQALAESQERLRIALGSAQLGTFDFDIRAGQVHWDARTREMCGIPGGQDPHYDEAAKFIHPDDREQLEARLAACFDPSADGSYEAEFRIVRPDGSFFWNRAQGKVYFEGEGPDRKAVRQVGVNQDITERKRAEEALAESEERLRLALAHAGTVVFTQDRDLRYTWVMNPNPGLGDGSGTIGRTDMDLLPTEDGTHLTAIKRRVLDTKRGAREVVRTTIAGEASYYDLIVEPTLGPDGGVAGIIASAADITERKRAEEALRAATHYADRLFDTRLIGVLRADEERIIDANDAFLHMVGHTREELEAGEVRWQEMTPPEWLHLDERALGQLRTAGEVLPYEKEYYRKDGSIVPILLGKVRLEESPLQWVCFVLDITERKRIEAELERVRNEFMGAVSHELRTPLTAIKGCASMALSSRTAPDPMEARELFEVVDVQTDRLTDLVGNLLDMTRIEAGGLSVQPEKRDLQGIVEDALITFKHGRYPNEVQVLVPDNLPLVSADGRRIGQVLLNLLTNAAKYSSDDMPIVISAEERGSEVIVSVRDKGQGVSDEKMPLLFQKFTQIHSRGTRGTGLGLFICKSVVEAHGGRIWADSLGEDKGSTFSFTLPVSDATPVGTRRERGFSATPEGSARPARVVVVDDEPDILRYVEHCLRGAGYEVTAMSDPTGVTRLVKSNPPDLVLLDMRLPGTSGLKVLKGVRRFSDVPVAFITAEANRADVVRGQEIRGTTWLEKPFSPRQLLDHVATVLGSRRDS